MIIGQTSAGKEEPLYSAIEHAIEAAPPAEESKLGAGTARSECCQGQPSIRLHQKHLHDTGCLV